MRSDVSRYVRKCDICKAQKSDNLGRAGLMGSPKTVDFPWQVIAIDLVGPLPRSKRGMNQLVVVTDWFTKYVVMQPLRKANADEVVKFLEDRIFLEYGVPQKILCDNGTQFISKKLKDLCRSYGVQKVWYNARYHAQVNFVERSNKTIMTAIRCYIKGDNHRTWDDNIAKISFALRTAVNEVTKFTPAFLNFGREVPSRGDYYGTVPDAMDYVSPPGRREDWVKTFEKTQEIFEDVKARLAEAYEKNAHSYNLRKRPGVSFCVGDTVWRKNYIQSDKANYFSSKLTPKYVKCRVRAKVGDLTYDLENEDGSDAGRWHLKDIKADNTPLL